MELLERLLDAEETPGPEVARWVSQAGAVAAEHLANKRDPQRWALVRRAWEGVSARRLREAWKATFPAVVAALDAGMPALDGPAAPPRPRRKARPVSLGPAALAIAWLLHLCLGGAQVAGDAALIVPQTLPAAVAPAHDSISAATLAIRGKEAGAPKPPPITGARGSDDNVA
jgi:hypothetical protein